MLARRMLTFMAVLLALTALAAAFAPPPPRNLDTGGSAAPPPPSEAGALVESKLDADERKASTITLQQGDRLSLEVRGEDALSVELRGLAGVRPLGPEAVAYFDIVADEPGKYPVVILEDSERTLAVVEVLPRPREGLAPADTLTDRRREI